MKNRISKIFLAILLILIALIVATLLIDRYRINNNQSSIFWNWGPFKVGSTILRKGDFSFKFDIIPSNKKKLIKLTKGALKQKYDYDIYYYEIKNVIVDSTFENTDKTYEEHSVFDLIDGLKKGKISMDTILYKTESDVEKGIATCEIHQDGITKKYTYETYSIIKNYAVYEEEYIYDNKSGVTEIKSKKTIGTDNVYIGLPSMQFEDII